MYGSAATVKLTTKLPYQRIVRPSTLIYIARSHCYTNFIASDLILKTISQAQTKLFRIIKILIKKWRI